MSRILQFVLAIAIPCTILHSVSHGQITVGSKVIRSTEAADTEPLKVDNRTVCTIDDLDWPCVVEHVNGNWLWIGDTKFHGWVQRSAVVTIDEYLKQTSEWLLASPTATNYVNRGIAWGCKGEWDLAIKDFSEAIRLEPNSGDLYWNRGEAKLKKGDAQAAVNDLTEAIRRLVQSPARQYEAYRQRAMAYDKLGDKNAAESDRREMERLKASLTK